MKKPSERNVKERKMLEFGGVCRQQKLQELFSSYKAHLYENKMMMIVVVVAL